MEILRAGAPIPQPVSQKYRKRLQGPLPSQVELRWQRAPEKIKTAEIAPRLPGMRRPGRRHARDLAERLGGDVGAAGDWLRRAAEAPGSRCWRGDGRAGGCAATATTPPQAEPPRHPPPPAGIVASGPSQYLSTYSIPKDAIDCPSRSSWSGVGTWIPEQRGRRQPSSNAWEIGPDEDCPTSI